MSVETIYNMGDDALQNLFDMSIGTIPYVNDLTATLVRVQGFTIPATGSGTYEVPYKTQKITKPSGKVETPNEFTFDFRVDRNWAIYKGFVAWKNAVANSYTGAIAPDNFLSNNRVPIDVWAVAPTGEPIVGFGKWSFKGCYPSSVGDIGFDYGVGDPIMVTITMQFLGLDDGLI